MVIAAAFVAMIRAFLLTILLAALFAGLSYPVYEWLRGRLRGRTALAAGLQQLVDQPGEVGRRLRDLPGYDRIEPCRAQILTKAGELVGSTSAFLFAVLSATTRATALFIFHVFVLSIIPGVGGALVWIPAAIILMTTALRPEVVVLDISMPELNGLEATRQIRGVVPANSPLDECARALRNPQPHHRTVTSPAKALFSGSRWPEEPRLNQRFFLNRSLIPPSGSLLGSCWPDAAPGTFRLPN